MSSDKKLAIVVSHPIQYFSPLFKVLSKEINLKVFYAFNPNPEQQGKEGFGKAFSWDIDLLEGYEFSFLENIAKYPTTSKKEGCDTPGVGKAIKEFNATHVVVFGWHLKTYLQAVKYCNRANIPVAVRGDSQYDPLQSTLKKLIKKVYFPLFLKRFDTFLSVGKRNRSYLKSFGVADDKIIFSPHSVDIDFWAGDKKKKKDIITFIWAAKFIDKKRPLDTIEAFIKAAESNSDIELKMVGSGELLEECKNKVGVHPKISFLGFKNQLELKELYLNSDAIILSSNYQETWGLVINEAFASYTPAIVSSACGCSEDLINEQTGVCYKFGNIEKLKTAILKISELLKNDRSHFERGIINKNLIYSFNHNIESFKQFMNS